MKTVQIMPMYILYLASVIVNILFYLLCDCHPYYSHCLFTFPHMQTHMHRFFFLKKIRVNCISKEISKAVINFIGLLLRITVIWTTTTHITILPSNLIISFTFSPLSTRFDLELDILFNCHVFKLLLIWNISIAYLFSLKTLTLWRI